MLWNTMYTYIKSWFIYHGIAWNLMIISIALAIVFGAIWLLAQWPPLFKKPWLWAVAVTSAFLTLLAVTFVQIPLAYYAGRALQHFWSSDTLTTWLYLSKIPSLLITGLVQEGAKMVPIVVWWWRSGKRIDPKMGLAIGALAGAGFEIYEAFWAHTQVFMSGWTWNEVSLSGFQALLPFWDRFWAVAMNIAISALVGYGLAKGRGWQFYLIASGLHAAVNYLVIFYQRGMLTFTQVEIFLAAAAALIMLAVIWLRWRDEWEKEEIEPTAPAGTDV